MTFTFLVSASATQDVKIQTYSKYPLYSKQCTLHTLQTFSFNLCDSPWSNLDVCETLFAKYIWIYTIFCLCWGAFIWRTSVSIELISCINVVESSHNNTKTSMCVFPYSWCQLTMYNLKLSCQLMHVMFVFLDAVAAPAHLDGNDFSLCTA